MSVIVEFVIDKEELAIGRALAGAGGGEIELERIVPTSNTVMPFFWVTHPDREALELGVEDSTYVKNLVQLDRVGDRSLYRVEWTGEYEDLLNGIIDTEGTLLEGRGNGEWQFILRFSDHDHVGQFYNFCTEHDIPIRIDRVYTLTEEALRGRMFDLTPEQREAILLALKRGYFRAPRETTMQELADELGISQQAFSGRLRRGVDTVLTNLFL